MKSSYGYFTVCSHSVEVETPFLAFGVDERLVDGVEVPEEVTSFGPWWGARYVINHSG